MVDATDPNNLRLSNSTTYAKIENLYTTIKEMFENGSQQSHMTLNLQFIVSQMMQVSERAPEDFGSAHIKLKKLISRNAKTFYLDYRNKGFYLIENYVGFVYCLLTLMSKSMVFSSAVYNILQNLSFLDGARLLQMKEKALRHLLNNDKLERMEFLFLSEMFQPDEESAKAFKPYSYSTPQLGKPGFPGLERKVSIKGEVAEKFLENLPKEVERIILKPTPFEGNIASYYNELLTKVPKEGYSKTKDLIEMNTIPSRYYIKKFNAPILKEHPNITYIKELGKNYAAKLKMETESKLKFDTPEPTEYVSTSPFTPDFRFQSPVTSSDKNVFITPSNDRDLFGSPSDFNGNDFKTPEKNNLATKEKSIERIMFARSQQTPIKSVKSYGSGKGPWYDSDEEEHSPDRYIIRNRKEDLTTPPKNRKYQLPSHLKKQEDSLKFIDDEIDFTFDSCQLPKRKLPKGKYFKK